ncbi:MAG: cytochrome P450 [Alphaproteobacteria bacterium]|nr:cytochrome P450 [Alphaproteobacteria bacterium]
MQPFDLYSPQIDADPFPMYAWLREEHPAYWNGDDKYWILSRYEDVLRAAQDWETFSSTGGNLVDEIPGRTNATLGTTDPPRHDRLRALAQAAFMKKNLDHVIEPVRAIAHEAVDAILVKQGAFDFVVEFSSVISVKSLMPMLGLPVLEPAHIRNKVVTAISTDRAVRGRNPELNAAFEWITGFIAAEVEKRRQNPQDDIVTKLAEAEIDGDRLSEKEVLLTTATFVMAGIESLSSFMTTFAMNMHDFPQAREAVIADPKLMPWAIEESLRFNTSAQRFKRTVAKPCELHGQTLNPGERVILAYGAANRDERKFPNADSYDVNRRPVGHLGFGSGKHFCLGAPLAKIVTEEAMNIFLQRIPRFRRSTPALDWVASSNFRSPKALPFALG